MSSTSSSPQTTSTKPSPIPTSSKSRWTAPISPATVRWRWATPSGTSRRRDAAGVRTVAVETGGFSRFELEHAGALAVYRDAALLAEQLPSSPIAHLTEGR